MDYALWLAARTLQLGVLVAMYRRGLYRQYPCFFNYTVLQTLSVPILVVIWVQWGVYYYYAYFTEMALSTLLSFAVLHDLLKNGLQTSGAVTRLIGFLLAATFVILVATEMSAIHAQSRGPLDTWTELISLTQRWVQIAQCSLMILLFVLRKRLGISRRSLLFGVTLGFGLFAAVNVFVTLQMARHGFLAKATLSRINSVAYLLTCGIWLGYAMAGSSREAYLLPETRGSIVGSARIAAERRSV